MPIDTYKPKGPLKSASPESGGADAKKYPVIGIVKDNIDPTRAGRIKVALQDGKGSLDPDSSDGWVTVQYLTSFFGSVRPSSGEGEDNYGSYKTNPSAYGQWQAPPDIGTKVVCVFVGGDPDAGFYIGCVPEPETLQMVPAIGASETVTLNEGEAKSYGGATRLPVTNLNTNNKDKADSNEFLNTPRPVHSYTASVMSQQGIIRDPLRGPISSSASREPASRVGWGVSTPGRPIYEGGYNDENLPENLDQGKAEQLKVISRRGGHSIVMDDGDIIGRDQLIRIRTALGHQILMSDDGQTLMILHSNGQSYIELGKEGTVDIFSTNSINMRTQGDFNIHADRDINMHAAENFNLQAKNIHTNSEEVTKSRAGKDYNITSLNNFTVKASAASAINAGGQASMVAGAEAFINGSKVNLNSGSASLSAEEVPIIPITAQADTLFDKEVGWAAAPAKLLTIASRAPAHYPWVNAGMGVDIKVSGSAEDNLPEPSSSAVQQVNQQAESTNPTPPAVATVSSVPPVPNVSDTIDNNTTNAVLAASATSAAVGPTSEAVNAGAGIVNQTGAPLISGINSALATASTLGAAATGVVNTANQISGSVQEASIALGAFAQTPDQLTQSGILKPGASSLAAGLASAGKTLTNSMPAALFTGLPGAESIEKLAENTTAQAASLVSIMQSSQQQLTEAGVINGTESNMQIAGLISASTTLGSEAVIDVVQQVNSTIPKLPIVDTGSVGLLASTTSTAQQASNLLNNIPQTTARLTSIAAGARSVLGAIGAGQAAAKLSDGIGGLGGIANSLTALSRAGTSLTGLLNSVKGVSGSAFSAIKDSFGTLEPNKPQYLSELAKQTASITAIAENSTSSQLPSSATNLSTLAADVRQTATTIAGIANNVNNTINSITRSTRAITSTVNSLTSLPNTIGVGTINNTLTNTTNQIASTINNATNAFNSLNTTVNSVTNTVNSVSTAVNNISSSSQQVSSLINSTTGAGVNTLSNDISTAFNNINSMAGAATSLNNGLSGLASAAKAVQGGGIAAKASQLASGVSNLPGGIKAFSSVADKSDTAINRIPGTEQLNGTMTSLQTQASTGVGQITSALGEVRGTINTVGSALGAASSAVNAVGTTLGISELSSAARTLGGLTSTISSKLPIGQATQLLSAVSALGAGGASPIKLPNLGFNTTNRAGLTAQIDSVIGDPGIPKPNLLGDISDQTISNLEQELIMALTEITNIENELSAALREENLAYTKLISIERDLPFGDPAITEARNAYLELTRRTAEIQERYLSIIEEGNNPINNSTQGFV
jgi:hypothetical protein